MEIFSKGEYRPVPSEFRTFGVLSLNELTKFQEKFSIFDTDTTINSIRDSIVANYLGFDLLNFSKHGFDAKKSNEDRFLEIKQCSVSSNRWGGTWNDTNEEKALAFSDPRLFTAIAIWKGASDLQVMIYGQHPDFGKYLFERVTQRKQGSRSTQNIAIERLIRDYEFLVIHPPDKTKEFVYNLLITYQRFFIKHVTIEGIKSLTDL